MTKESYSPISEDQQSLQEKDTGKKSVGQLFIDAFWELFDGPTSFIDNIVYKFSNIAEVNFNIAQNMADNNQFTDALFRLKIVLWFSPNYQPAHYLAGCCHIGRGDMRKAAQALHKALLLKPDDENTIFMLAVLDPSVLTPEQLPRTMPFQMALDHFNDNALEYENVQAAAGYKGHQLADMAVWDALDPRRVDYEVLELGCGTGLCGTLLSERCEYLVGVDFCKAMLDIAKNKRRPDRRRVYSECLLQDARNYMIDLKEPRFDAIVAAHVLNYIGDVQLIFEGAARGLKSGGVFVFQVEGYQEGYGLLSGLGRFGHSESFIRELCQSVGLEVVEAYAVKVFPDYELGQYTVRKP